MSNRRVVIGVTGPDHGGLAAWFFTAIAVLCLGGRPVRITPARRHSIRKIDGLIIGGGADISPERYADNGVDIKREFTKANTRGFSPVSWILFPMLFIFRKLLSTKQYAGHDISRDNLEFRLLAEAVEQSLPVLGICRGAQLINVYFGGTLYQDIKEFYVESPQVWTVFPKKIVTVIPDTQLSDALLGYASCRVNALHNQAIKEPGGNITVSAMEHNQVIQAIEHDKLPFVLGVQWHPEYLFMIQTSQRNLFRTFIRAVCRQKDREKENAYGN